MAKPAASVSRFITVRLQAVWQSYMFYVLVLSAPYIISHFYRGIPVEHETWAASVIILLGALLGLLLTLLSKTTPLGIFIDYRAGQVACYQIGLPWKTKLPLNTIYCQLKHQVNHNGGTHFLVVFRQKEQVWAIAESNWWPLAQLELLQELLIRNAS